MKSNILYKNDYNYKFNEFFRNHRFKHQTNKKLNNSTPFSLNSENKLNENQSFYQDYDEYSHLIPQNSFLKIDENIFKDYKKLYKTLINKERNTSTTKIKLTPFQKIVELKKSIKQKLYEKGLENNNINRSIGEMKIQKIDQKDCDLILEPLINQKSAYKDKNSIIKKFQRINIQEGSDRFVHKSLIEDQLSPLISEQIFTNDKQNNYYDIDYSTNQISKDKDSDEQKVFKEKLVDVKNKKDYTNYYKSLRESVFFKNFGNEEDNLKIKETIKNSKETQTINNLINNKTRIFLKNNNLSLIKEKTTEANISTKESALNIQEKDETNQNLFYSKKILDTNVIRSYNNAGIDKKKKINLITYNDSNNNKSKKNDFDNSKGSRSKKIIFEEKDPLQHSNEIMKNNKNLYYFDTFNNDFYENNSNEDIKKKDNINSFSDNTNKSFLK